MASGKGIKLSQLARARVIAQGKDIVPILGSRNPKRVEQNVAAVDAVTEQPFGTRFRSLHGNNPARVAI